MRSGVFYAAIAALQSLASADAVVESLHGVPQGWRKLKDAESDRVLKLRIALEQPNTALFEQTLYEVSDPEHPLYGKHLKRDELKEMMKPRAESTDVVLRWLREAGVPSNMIEDAGDWINFKTTVGVANDMLKTTFGVYEHEETETVKVRATKYSVPDEVKSHITMVAPITRFGQLRAMRSHIFEIIDVAQAKANIQAVDGPAADFDLSTCNATITPQCLRALYKIGDYTAKPVEGSHMGVAGYLDQYAKYGDLALFKPAYAPYALDATFDVVSINGGKNIENSTLDSGEANLDIQYALAINYKQPTTYYTTGGRGPLVPDLDQPDPDNSSNEPYLDFLEHMLSLKDDELPQTLTTSYGEDEQSVPRPYVEKVCQMFGQLGARGVSILFSSGDTGVASACQTNDGKNTTRFLPIFPAACPHVTSVGGTRYVEPEYAVSFSSGGFSDVFPRPRWQDAAVGKYLEKLGDQWKGLYNPNGRGFPDVAAQGVRYHVFDHGRDALISGTSASAPMFAALVSLLNNARMAEGKPPLGWLNPWLYKEGYKGLTDITHGGSTGCTGRDIYSGLPTPFVPYASWNATEGWDPVTGLGTPLFDKLLELSKSAKPCTKKRSVASRKFQA
ncbi:uncharacterized protein E0L32_005401 [Thyridium curvatum]|uniref:tripeptidyl-peptidase II n=1 Tax=Thyridium curvatum TaxID=1093900 RepID=A0A507B3V9_9PEZI|nr:uncharacterized protein E0L32_005401 [Thyridium curvatum]TPX14437.1 hypothetical protein E0L32_005401 [Thyridium curvatum]